jgi:hypothetical protein
MSIEKARQILPEHRTFVANGNTYTIGTAEDSLTIARYKEYEKLQLEFNFDATFESVASVLKQASKDINDITLGKSPNKSIIHVFAQLQTLLEKFPKAGESLSYSRANFALLLCTLFINRTGEDLTKWNREAAQEKINDWIAEGYGLHGFFLLVIDFLRQLKSE